MAEKILKTRIQLRYDTLTNWEANNPVLKAGEIAVVSIPSAPTKDVNSVPAPQILFKVGDGTTAFKLLKWASGLAADVYDWAKAPKKPSYNYNEIGDLPTIPTVGNGKITINQDGKKKGEFTVNQDTDTTINLTDIDTDTQYQLVLNDHTLKLQSKAKGATEWTDVSGQSFELPDTTYEIANATTAGLVKSSTTGTMAGRDYKVQVNTDGTMKVNVPWTDTNTHQSIKTLDTTATAAQDTNASEAIAGSGKITLHKVSKTGNYNDLLNKPTIGNGALTIKVGKNGDESGTGTFTANQSTAGTITLPVYTKTEVDAMVTGAVQYLGTVSSTTELAALNPDSLGDFCRVSTAFGSYHVGDLLLCKTLKTSSDAATWDVIHGEIDKDTWVANSKTAAGYVAAGGTNANKVWKTDSNGNPGWRDDANTNTAHAHTAGDGLKIDGNGGISGTTTYSLKVATSNEIGGVKPGTTSGKNYGVAVAADGSMTVNVPWEDNDTKVTSAANHYTPSADTGSELTADAKNGASATWNTTQLVTGVNIQRDAKGHVTGVSVDSIKMPANPDTWRQINVNGTQFKGAGTATGAVNFKNGSNVTITGSGNDITIAAASANNAALKDTSGRTIFTANASEDVTITVINCGTSADTW